MPHQKYRIILADPPWPFDDKLKMSEVKRGSEANYSTMTMDDIKRLPVESWAKTDSLLALWVPSSLLTEGLDVLDRWGFVHKQIVTWVKTSKSEAGLAFGMGRYFRGCTEHVLIGVRGKLTPHVVGKSERNVILSGALPHSQKPEDLHDSLERMIPKGPYLELFARRERKGWRCVGLECPTSLGQDIRQWKPPRLK